MDETGQQDQKLLWESRVTGKVDRHTLSLTYVHGYVLKKLHFLCQTEQNRGVKNEPVTSEAATAAFPQVL